MKPWNKPIRIDYRKPCTRLTLSGEKQWKGEWGVTNWMVGTCNYPWSPWVQFHFGRLSIQIKWYLIAALAVAGAFFLGTLF